jgi:hypothetical protein
MAYDSYKLTQNISSPSPQKQMMLDKAKQVEYLYGLAMDRVDDCTINSHTFVQSPRIFNRKTEVNSTQSVMVETIDIGDKFYVGDLLQFDGDNWLCTTSFVFHKLYCKGEFTRCNYTIKFQSPTGTILSYPCITETNKSIGIDEGDVLTTLSGTVTMKVPFDSNTVLLKEDKRLYLDKDIADPRSFRITKVDNVSYNYGDKGLIELTLKQCETGEPNDNIALGICNYVAPVVVPDPVEGYSYSTITCSNPNNEIKLGSSILRTLIPTWYEANGNISTETILAVWSFEYPVGYENQFTVVVDGNNRKIKVAANYDLLGKTVRANVMGSNGGYGGSITLNIII